MQTQVYKDIYDHEMRHWWYCVRRALVFDLMARYMVTDVESKILDVGCGAGGLMSELQTCGSVYGVDFSQESIDFCLGRGLQNVQRADVTNLPFKDNFFDAVICLDVLEHVEDDGRGASELYRVLKPGGCAIIFVPALMMLWGKTDEVSEHKRRYTKGNLLKILQNANFSILRSSYFNSLLFVPILLVRLFSKLTQYKVVDEYKPGNGFINKILHKIFKFEMVLLRHISFPAGVSILAVCKKT